MQKAAGISLILGTLLLGTTVMSGCGSVSTLQQANNTPTSVEVAQAANGWISKGPIYVGTVQPAQEVDVLPKIPGKVASINVAMGSRVKKGDVLYTLDDKDVQDAINQAQAAASAAQANVQNAQTQQQSAANQASGGVVSAKSGLIQAENAVSQAQNGIVQAQNAVTTTKKAFDDATTNKSRYEQLYALNSIPKAQLEQVQTAYVAAQAAYENAQKGLQTAQAGLETAQKALNNAKAGYGTAQNQASVAQSQAGVEYSRQAANVAQAGLKTAQDHLGDVTVTSPIDGVVGVKNVEIGDFVNPDIPSGQPTLVVANLDPAKVLVYVPADAINQVKVGAPVMVKAVALNTYFKGQIKSISPLDNLGKGYPVEISVPNADQQLKKGMVAQVSLLGPDAKQGTIIPTSALTQENGKSYVFIAENNTAKRKEVTVMDQLGSETLISSGVQAGEQVITSQISLLQDGSKLTIEANQTN
jgi:HlyD family secretion protein